VAGAWTGVRVDAAGHAALPGDPVLAAWRDTWQRRAAAWSAAAEGRTTIDALVAGARAAGERGDFVTVLELASDVRRLGEPRRALELLRHCPSGPSLLAAEVDAAEAALSGDPQRWGRAADGFLALGARAQAAECLVQWSRAIGGSRSAALGARATDLLEECEGLRTPLSSSVRAALTGREREVAVMAADGHPSAHIAERLGISVRTVDNLLARCYTKLDVSGRRDLPAALSLVGGVR
jgi:DNA-binding CsgD family transcriptional regulator